MHLFFRKDSNGKLGSLIDEKPKSSIKVGIAREGIGEYPFFTSGDAILRWPDFLVDGRVCLLNTGGNADVKFYVGQAAYSTDTWCITGKEKFADYLFSLLSTIKSELNQKFFLGTGLKHLQKPLLKNRSIYIPTDTEITEFNEVAVPANTTISENQRENIKLASLRDWLLPMLMNGQATISSESTKLSFT